jgi:hypothetical protein
VHGEQHSALAIGSDETLHWVPSIVAGSSLRRMDAVAAHALAWALAILILKVPGG